MLKKQKTTWQVCYDKGILDNSKGPFFSGKNAGESVTEKTLRVFIFMIGVMVAAQLLNLFQSVYVQADQVPVIYGQNTVRETISQGYLGSYYKVLWPNQEQETETNSLAIGPERVLSAQVYRAQATAVKTVSYQAELVEQNYDRMEIETGKAFTFEVKFRNKGTATWSNCEGSYVAINVAGPTGRHSLFQHDSWTEYYYRPGRLKEVSVKPGDIGTFRFALQAPDVLGEHIESFGLVAENLTWINGGHVSLLIDVVPPQPPYSAEIAEMSTEQLELNPGEVSTVWFDMKNTGTVTWSNTGDHFLAINVIDPTGRHSDFQHDSWSEYYYRPTRLDDSQVLPNQIGRFTFTVKAPLRPGEYIENFAMVAEHLVWVPGGEVSLPIHVSKTVVDEQPNEPDIRVGLYSADTTNNQVQLTADGDYLIVNGEGKTLAELDAGDETTITFSQDKYHCTADGTKLTSNSHIRFVPAEGQVVFELLNYEHRPAWNTDLNDNNFRSKIEVRYSTTTEKLWVINELPLEQYLRGVAEASNDDYPEYLKALIVAERTYAQYHLNTGTKHADEHYTIDATYDQVYRGYNFEVRAPKIADQIDETTGLMVTYEDEVVVTPYFSHTDGRTRSWEEVWSGGPYPWLTSVPDPASEGLAMLGHGVGLSALGARDLASEGSTYDAILSYFYQDIVLKIIY